MMKLCAWTHLGGQWAKKTALGALYMGVGFVPVPLQAAMDKMQSSPAMPAMKHENEGRPAASVSLSASKGKVLFYRNPMGSDTSPVPKKDSMGMDYVAVYAEDEGNAKDGGFHLSADRVQMLGVTSVAAQLSSVPMPDIEVTGTTRFDEQGLHTLSSWSAGWVTHLYVATTGERVVKGQKLADIYAPDIAASEEEYILAARSGAAVRRASVQRLFSLGVDRAEIARLQKGGKPRRLLSLYAPMNGVITELLVQEGARVELNQPLYKMASTQTMWVLADIPERLLSWVEEGDRASISFAAYPGQVYKENINLLYPSLDPQARTLAVRIVMHAPPSGMRANMYARVSIHPKPGRQKYVVIPSSALLNQNDAGNGVNAMVIVDKGQGHFAARAVKIGPQAQGEAAVLSGLAAHDRVVVNAAFLLDSESNIRSALQGFNLQGEKMPDTPASASDHPQAEHMEHTP